jgi:acyl transferase domain-containing protein
MATQNMAQRSSQLQATPIAIIGMAALFPQARNLQEYWDNIIGKKDCISDVPSSHWNIEDYYDPDASVPDKTYAKRGGFLPEIDFDPLEFGLPPDTLQALDSAQMLSLIIAKAALENAGYGKREFNRETTGVILGASGLWKTITPLAARLQYPIWEKALKSSGLSDEDTQKIIEKIKLAYVPWEENSFPGMLTNVVAGRITNRLDLGGTNCVVDAACASSLSAIKMAISELIEHRCDMVIAGGIDTDNSILNYMCFSKTPAFSKKDYLNPFDADSDGMMVGEGLGMLVLKRLDEAERDGDRIYAIIKGVGTSSDGRYKSIYAPRPEGQTKALRRAYQDAGEDPATVGLIEAHGTGTPAGDMCEFTALNQVFGENNPRQQHIALGSVKSQIGHTKAAAGAASLIKVALSLHHKVLPPTINIAQPNPKFNLETSPFYLNTETRPWIHEGDTPRRAGVSSFGFGGTNFHLVLEEYCPNSGFRPPSPPTLGGLEGKSQSPPLNMTAKPLLASPLKRGTGGGSQGDLGGGHADYSTENSSKLIDTYRLQTVPQSLLIAARSPEQLLHECESFLTQLEGEAGERHYKERLKACQSLVIPVEDARVGFVATSIEEAKDLLKLAIKSLKTKGQAESWEHPRGVYYRKTGIPKSSKVVALFPGQGAQYLNMGRELAINFPELQQAYGEIDKLFYKQGLPRISQSVFPRPALNSELETIQTQTLQRTENAQPAIGAFSVGLYKILQQAGFQPDFVAGHSFGELTALWAAGVLSESDYFYLVKARGQAMSVPDSDDACEAGTMLAVSGEIHKLQSTIGRLGRLKVANFNSPKQVVLSGAKPEIAAIQQILSKQGYSVTPLPVSAAFHSAFVSHAVKPFAEALAEVTFQSPKLPVFSNTTGKPYPDESHAIKSILQDHLLNPVNFQQEIENIYGSGGYCFVEIGPRQILTNLVKEILGDRPHLAIALNPNRAKNSDLQMRQALIQLRVAGLPLVNCDRYEHISVPVEPKKGKQLKIRLNGSNYVSEQTKTAFTKALQVEVESRWRSPSEGRKSKVVETRNFASLQSKSSPLSSLSPLSSKGRTLSSCLPKDAPSTETQPISNTTSESPMHNSEKEILPVVSQNPSEQVFGSSLDKILKLFYEHQGEILRVHEQYLKIQVESPQAFLQMLQQLYGLLANNGNLIQKLTIETPTPEKKNGKSANGHQDSVSKEEIVWSPPATNGNGKMHSTPVQTTEVVIEPAYTPVVESVKNIPVVESPAPSHQSLKDSLITDSLLSVVSDKTGYPAEMLELEMDLEADLGIDSIKRVEIMGAMQELFPQLPKLSPEELAEKRTLASIVEYLNMQLSMEQKKIAA